MINIFYGMVWFFDNGVPSVPVEHISLRQCHVVWRRLEGGCTVKKRSFFTVGECILKRIIFNRLLKKTLISGTDIIIS